MIYFKVIKIKENNSVYVTAIPGDWEKDNILYWPENLDESRREQLRSNPSSLPQNNWTQYPCEVQFSGIAYFKEALKIEGLLSNCDDTGENIAILSNKGKQTRYKEETIEIDDGNFLFEKTVSNDNQNALTQHKMEEDPNILEDKMEEEQYEATSAVGNFFCIPENESSSKQNERCVTLPEEVFLSMQTKLKDMENCINNLKQEMHTNHYQVVTILANLEKLIINRNNENLSTSDVNVVDFNFPINSIMQVEELEMKLADPKLKNKLVSKFSTIEGTDGRKNGARIAYRLIDHIFSKEILTNYSWTGISKDKTKPTKIAFNAYKSILSLIFEILKNADDRWTIKDTENILKEGVLKHAKKRSLRDNKKAIRKTKQNIEHTTTGGDILESNKENI